ACARSARRARSARLVDVCVCSDAGPAQFCSLSLHDALPIWPRKVSTPATACRGHAVAGFSFGPEVGESAVRAARGPSGAGRGRPDRKSTRLDSSHVKISYAVFCLPKKLDANEANQGMTRGA